MGDGRAEEGHDPVPHHLVHGALVAMDRLHDALQHGVKERARLLGISVGQEFQGTAHVGKEHRHPLALPRQGRAQFADPLGQVGGCVGVRRRGSGIEEAAAVIAEAAAGRILVLAAGTAQLRAFLNLEDLVGH